MEATDRRIRATFPKLSIAVALAIVFLRSGIRVKVEDRLLRRGRYRMFVETGNGRVGVVGGG